MHQRLYQIAFALKKTTQHYRATKASVMRGIFIMLMMTHLVENHAQAREETENAPPLPTFELLDETSAEKDVKKQQAGEPARDGIASDEMQVSAASESHRIRAELHGAVVMQYTGALKDRALGRINMTMLTLEARLETRNVGIFIVPRLRLDDLLKPVEQSAVLMPQAYAYFRYGAQELRLGKILARFGRPWDYGLYGPLVANNEMKMVGDVGISLEGTLDPDGPLQVAYAAQYSPVDATYFPLHGVTLPRDELGARHHTVTLRVAPEWRPREGVSVQTALSGQRFEISRSGRQVVRRVAGDVSVEWGPFSAFAEVGRQFDPAPLATDRLSLSAYDYLWSGLQATRGPLQLHYHLNLIRYDGPDGGQETLHQPGAIVTIREQWTLAAELAFWRNSSSLPARGENGIYFIAGGKF